MDFIYFLLLSFVSPSERYFPLNTAVKLQSKCMGVQMFHRPDSLPIANKIEKSEIGFFFFFFSIQ